MRTGLIEANSQTTLHSQSSSAMPTAILLLLVLSSFLVDETLHILFIWLMILLLSSSSGATIDDNKKNILLLNEQQVTWASVVLCSQLFKKHHAIQQHAIFLDTANALSLALFVGMVCQNSMLVAAGTFGALMATTLTQRRVRMAPIDESNWYNWTPSQTQKWARQYVDLRESKALAVMWIEGRFLSQTDFLRRLVQVKDDPRSALLLREQIVRLVEQYPKIHVTQLELTPTVEETTTSTSLFSDEDDIMDTEHTELLRRTKSRSYYHSPLH